MQKNGFLQISPLLVFLVCTGLYFGNWRYIVFGLMAAMLHEMGHFSFLLLAGKSPQKLSFRANCAVMEAKALSYTEELLCALCGPAVNLLFCLLFLNVQPVFAGISLALAMYNLLPIFPLDGGRVVRTVLLLHLEEARSRKIMRNVNFCFSLLVMFFAVWFCAVLQCSLWPVLAVGLILVKLDVDARQEWH